MRDTFTLEGETYIYVPFEIKSIWNARIRYLVDSEHTVAAYIVDENDLNKFKNTDEWEYYAGYESRLYFNEKVHLPKPGKYYLVIWNKRTEPTAVHYELYTIK